MKITREEESKIKGTPEVSAPALTETPEQPAAAAKPATRWAAIPLWWRVLLIIGIAATRAIKLCPAFTAGFFLIDG